VKDAFARWHFAEPEVYLFSKEHVSIQQ